MQRANRLNIIGKQQIVKKTENLICAPRSHFLHEMRQLSFLSLHIHTTQFRTARTFSNFTGSEAMYVWRVFAQCTCTHINVFRQWIRWKITLSSGLYNICMHRLSHNTQTVSVLKSQLLCIWYQIWLGAQQ